MRRRSRHVTLSFARERALRFLHATLVTTLLSVVVGSCSSDQTPPEEFGTLKVATSSATAFPSVDSWRATINGPSGTQSRSGAPGTVIEFTQLRAGNYGVALEGLQQNVAIVRGEGNATISVGATAQATVAVTPIPATLAIVSGDEQLGWSGDALLLPVVMRLTNPAGGPIAGASVTITSVSGGGAPVGNAAITTDANGQVAVSYRLGSALGAQQFRADVQGQGVSLSATASLLAVEPRRTRIVGGAFFSCGVFGNSTYCWGSNQSGSLGTRTVDVTRDTVLPVRIGQDPGFVALTANEANNVFTGNVCGLTAGGAAYCWGLSPIGGLGQTPADICVPGFGRPEPLSNVPCFREPRQVSGGIAFKVIDVGGMGVELSAASSKFLPERLCGVSTSGDAYCWGENRDGAIGDSSTTSRTAPTLVGGGRKWIDIATGTLHTCALTVFGEAFCWGTNSVGTQGIGSLGTGDTVSSNVPRRVATTERFRAIDAGWRSTCALTTAASLFCWSLDQGTTPPLIGGFGNALVPVPGPPGTQAFARISVGLAHACGVTEQGAAYCWGTNNRGTLGDGTPTSNPITTSYIPVRVLSSTPLREIAAGALQSCAFDNTGDAYCWGSGSNGELGNGSRSASSVPVRVTLTAALAGGAAQPIPKLPSAPWLVQLGPPRH